MAMDPNFMREILMDHYSYPRNKELKNDEGYLSKHMASESCIDDITVQAKIIDDIIKDVNFDGVACTISTAATDIMADLLEGKSIEDAENIIDNYFKMIDEKDYDEDLLDEANALHNVGKQANRIKCATIGWNAMKDILAQNEEKKNG